MKFHIFKDRTTGTPYEVAELLPDGKVGHSIRIHEINYRSGIFGINWAGIGTVDTNEAKRYAALITKAAEVCEKLNK